jgi:hypothetical protein
MSFKLSLGVVAALAIARFLDASGAETKPLATPAFAVTAGDAIAVVPATDGLSAKVHTVKAGSAQLTVTVDGIAQVYDFTVAEPAPNPVASFVVTVTDEAGAEIVQSA